MNKAMRCPFCQPGVSKAMFAETSNFIAVYNIAPILPGHCLIVPKKHIHSFLDIPDNLMTEMVVFSRKIIRTLQEAFETKAFDWTIQEGIEAGQTVDHMHIHIIPRKTNDLPNPGDWYPKLLDSFSELIDSSKRPRHTKVEMEAITMHLSTIFNTIT